MFTRRPSPTDDTLRLAVQELGAQTARVCAVLERQTAVEADRLAFERERFHVEQRERAELREEQAKWRAQAEGADLPETVRATAQRLAGDDRVLLSKLAAYAARRLREGITEEMVSRELKFGDTRRVTA